ncbi:MAG: hypothetical protein WC444_06990 [Candidatus Paceibacterota bacterium]
MGAKTKTTNLLAFLKKVTFNNALNDILLDFRADGVHVRAMSSNILFSEGLLKKSAFTEYEAIGRVGIPNCTKLVNLLKTKKGDILLSKTADGKLCYAVETSAAHIPLCEDKFVSSNVEEQPPFIPNLDAGFNLTSTEFKKILTDWNTIGSSKIEVISDGKSLTFSTEDDTGYQVAESFPVKYTTGKTLLGLCLKDVMKVAEGNLNVTFKFTTSDKDNLPLRVREEREHYTVDLIIAPLDPDSETHKKAQEEAKKRQDAQDAEEKAEAVAASEVDSDGQ